MERAYNGSDGGNILYGYALSTEGEREGACVGYEGALRRHANNVQGVSERVTDVTSGVAPHAGWGYQPLSVKLRLTRSYGRQWHRYFHSIKRCTMTNSAAPHWQIEFTDAGEIAVRN